MAQRTSNSSGGKGRSSVHSASSVGSNLALAIQAKGNRRPSLVVDGPVPEMADNSKPLGERLALARRGLVDRLRDATWFNTLLPAILVLTTTVAILTYHSLNKIIFGDRTADELPNKFVLVALTRSFSACLYWVAARVVLPWEEMKEKLMSVKVWAVCLPYALGILGCFVMAIWTLEFLALAARNAIVQSRLLLDLLLGGVLLGVPVTLQKVTGIATILCSVGVSMLTVKQSATSKDPQWGMVLTLIMNVLCSCTYAYFPFVLKHVNVSPNICSWVCAVEVFLLCVILTFAQALQEGRGIEVVGSFQPLDFVLVFAVSVTDTCYFVVPLLMPPIVLTLCLSMTIPLGYFLENLYFNQPFELQPCLTMVTVGLATISYTVATAAAAAAKKPVEAAPQTPQDESAEGRYYSSGDGSRPDVEDGKDGTAAGSSQPSEKKDSKQSETLEL